MSSKLLLVKADICFSTALALSFFDVDFALIFSPNEACFGVVMAPELASTGATFGVVGITPVAGWILGEGGVGCAWELDVELFLLELLLLLLLEL